MPFTHVCRHRYFKIQRVSSGKHAIVGVLRDDKFFRYAAKTNFAARCLLTGTEVPYPPANRQLKKIFSFLKLEHMLIFYKKKTWFDGQNVSLSVICFQVATSFCFCHDRACPAPRPHTTAVHLFCDHFCVERKNTLSPRTSKRVLNKTYPAQKQKQQICRGHSD